MILLHSVRKAIKSHILSCQGLWFAVCFSAHRDGKFKLQPESLGQARPVIRGHCRRNTVASNAPPFLTVLQHTAHVWLHSLNLTALQQRFSGEQECPAAATRQERCEFSSGGNAVVCGPTERWASPHGHLVPAPRSPVGPSGISQLFVCTGWEGPSPSCPSLYPPAFEDQPTAAKWLHLMWCLLPPKECPTQAAKCPGPRPLPRHRSLWRTAWGWGCRARAATSPS